MIIQMDGFYLVIQKIFDGFFRIAQKMRGYALGSKHFIRSDQLPSSTPGNQSSWLAEERKTSVVRWCATGIVEFLQG